MKIFRHHAALPDEFRQAAIAIGNFDGVHLGHQGVIQEAGRIASANDVPWGVMTFEPHPRMFFKPDQPPFRLTPMRAKTRFVATLDVDFMITLRFDRDLAAMSADDFITEILVKDLDVFHVVCGYDFSFGRGAKGNCELLLQMGMKAGFGMTAVGAIDDDGGETYSSTRVRECLRNGDPAAAAGLLGRPFEIAGRVQRGDQRGQTIGFPTANIYLEDYIEPKRGVYAVRAALDTPDAHDEPEWMPGVANMGIRPTFDKSEPVLEVFLFDVDADLYEQNLRVQFVAFIRPEQKFDGLDALKAQIATDCETARGLLK